MQLKTRVLIIILASLLGLITMGAFGLHAMRQSMYEERRSQISQLLDFSETLLKHYHAQEVSGKLTREEAQARAKEAIGAQRATSSRTCCAAAWIPAGSAIPTGSCWA